MAAQFIRFRAVFYILIKIASNKDKTVFYIELMSSSLDLTGKNLSFYFILKIEARLPHCVAKKCVNEALPQITVQPTCLLR